MGFTTWDYLSFGLTVAAYVLTALALYTIAKRRGIKRPWLAWIPVADMWLLGCISDQYRYVTKGQVTNRRKTLLTLNIVWMVLFSWALVMLTVMVIQFLPYLPEELKSVEQLSKLATMTEAEQNTFLEEISMKISSPTPEFSQILLIEAVIIIIPTLVATVCMVVHTVLMYKCIYDVFLSTEPMLATMRLTLSIVGAFFGLGILRPIFLFSCREKDLGMPPRGYYPPAGPMSPMPPVCPMSPVPPIYPDMPMPPTTPETDTTEN